MEPKTRQRLELFAGNVSAMRGEFVMRGTLLRRLSALLYAAEDKAVDPAAIHECFNLIKQSAGPFSSFRGDSALTIATLLSLRDQPSVLLDGAIRIYHELKQAKFRASSFLAIAAYQIAANAQPERYSAIVQRSRAFYEGMKQYHRFLTGQDDYIFSAMLGLSDIEVEAGVTKMERLFQRLRPEFHTGIGVQALVQVLALGKSADDAEARLFALRDALRQRHLKMEREYSLSSLGILSLLPMGSETIANELDETAQSLRAHKGFGSFSVTKQELLLLASGLVAMGFIDKASQGVVETSLFTSITNIIIAQQTAIAAAAGASSAAAASSSSS